jgi:hypothetical protein
MCNGKTKKRFLAIRKRKYEQLVKFINPADANFAAIKTAEIITCINRDEIFN